MSKRLPLVINIVLFLLAMGWFSRGLVFPPFYHPDEINKVTQIQENFRNFNHPQLMLNSAAVLYWLGGSPESALKTATLTRWVSVFFAAATVVLLAHTAFLLAGPVAQIACGWLLLTRPLLFELAHYLKEDPALTMGFAAVYLSFLLYVRGPSPGRAALTGLAAALAISAKYIGVFPALLALGGILWVGRGQPRQVLLFAIVLLVACAAINWQTLVQLSQFRSGLNREVGLFAERATSLINEKNFDDVRGEIGGIAWLAVAAWLASPFYRHKRLGAGEWLILATTFGYAVLIVLSSRSANRYLLPLAVSLPLIIAVAAGWVGSWLAGRFKWSPAFAQAALCVPIFLIYGARDQPGLVRLYHGFHTDSRRDLIAFVRENLPADAVLAEDFYAKIPDGTFRRTYEGWELNRPLVRTETNRYLGEEFTVAGLREKGATHVVIFADRKTLSALEKQPAEKTQSLGRFLSELQSGGGMLWSCESSEPAYLHPPLRLYKLPTAE